MFARQAMRLGGRVPFMFQLMLSLDPATITERSLPKKICFKTGERLAFGTSVLVDAQHRTNFFVWHHGGLGVTYARRVGEHTKLQLYFARRVGAIQSAWASWLPTIRARHRNVPQGAARGTIAGFYRTIAMKVLDEYSVTGKKCCGGQWILREPKAENESRWNIRTMVRCNSWSGRVCLSFLQELDWA